MNNQIDFSGWMNNPAQDPIQLYAIPGVHPDVQPCQEAVERTIRARLQAPFTGQQQPPRFRVALYQVMSANRYANQDYTRLVGNTLARIHAAWITQNLNPQQSIPLYVERTIEAEILRLYEYNQAGWGGLSQAEAQELGRINNDRQVDENMIGYANQMAAQNVNQYPRQQFVPQQSIGSMYGSHVTQSPTVNALLGSSTSSFHDAVAASKTTQTPQQPTTNVNPLGQIGGSPYSQAKIDAEPDMISMGPNGISVQQGGTEVNFDQFFPAAPTKEETEMNNETLKHPTVDLSGHLYPIVYDQYTHQFDPNTGKVMEYAKHQLIPELRPEEPSDGIIVPFYTHPGDVAEEGIVRHFLTTSKYEFLTQPIVGLSAVNAFHLVDFYEDVWNTGTLTEFTILRTETEFVNNPKRFVEDYACLLMGSNENKLGAYLTALNTMRSDYPLLFKLINERATVAVNEILTQRLGLAPTIDSFVDDWFDLLEYLRGIYGNAIDQRIQSHLALVRAATACIARNTLHDVLLKHNASFRNMESSVGLEWDIESRSFVAPNAERKEALDADRAKVEAETSNSECLIQLVDYEYCALLPIEYASLGFELEVGTPMVVQTSLQPDWSLYLRDLVARAGGANSICRRVLISTIDDRIIQVHPTHGVDVEGNQLMALTLQA